VTAQLLDGKALAARVRAELKAKVAASVARGERPPGLAVVLVGDDPASHTYVRNKEKAAKEVGFRSEVHLLPAGIDPGAVRHLVQRLGEREEIDGILVQLPLPAGMDPRPILEAVPPAKDVDGFTAVNAGRLLAGQPGHIPCTPKGILRLLSEGQVPLAGRRAVVLGRSLIVGKPMALLLLQQDATVTVAHSRTRDLPGLVAEAEVLVAAVGRPGFVQASWVRPGAAVVDVGVHRTEDGWRGDVDPAVAEVAGYLTPVPGGVGPMTIAMLLENTWDARRWTSS
jgi:methylenetetrahydrofolate dehydrogenase (NADP+)/methenyltetrahydrofolate cyclohydrolase